MKYYSETLKSLFNTEAELNKAETEAKKKEYEAQLAESKKKAERATRAKEVSDAIEAAAKAQTNAYKLLKDFTKDYGSFHMSYSTPVDEENQGNSFLDILNAFLNY